MMMSATDPSLKYVVMVQVTIATTIAITIATNHTNIDNSDL